jgi:hypothetical protein
VDARPAPDVYDDELWELATAYRVTLWEQPANPPEIDEPRPGWSPFPGAPMGWEEMTFELVGAQDVRTRSNGRKRLSRQAKARPAAAAARCRAGNT